MNPEADSGTELARRKADLRGDMEAAHHKTWSILLGFSPAELDTRLDPASAESWTIRQVIAHLADAERGLLGQAQRVARGEAAVPPEFDRDRWNRSAVRRRSSATVPDLLREIEAAHQDALDFLEGLDETSLSRSGVGSMGYALTVEGFLRRMAEHREEHVAEMREAVPH